MKYQETPNTKWHFFVFIDDASTSFHSPKLLTLPYLQQSNQSVNKQKNLTAAISNLKIKGKQTNFSTSNS